MKSPAARAAALVVRLFAAVFFRGFVQQQLVAAWGPVGGIGGAAAFCDVGYGMAGTELVFLFGLGVVYAVAVAMVWAARYRRRHPPEPVPLSGARRGGVAGVPPPGAG